MTAPARPPCSASLPQANQWIARHHYTYWIAYQPHDRLCLFQFAVTAVPLAATAGVVAATTWRLRRRAAE